VFFARGAADPGWQSFPNACRADCSDHVCNNTVLNCVRAGTNVPSPLFQLGSGPIMVPVFNATVNIGVQTFKEILNEKGDFRDCSLITESSGPPYFLHYRCLSQVLGYPDDLAMALQCSNGALQLWLHSQSRLLDVKWDAGVNDARVRLVCACYVLRASPRTTQILNYAMLPASLFAYSSNLQNGTCA
jgi:hypothetical protein